MTVPPVPPIDRAAVTPSVDSIAMLLRTRTLAPGGGDAGTFTSETHPSDVDVEQVIELAADEVLGQLPAAVEVRLYPAVERMIGLRAAMTIEVSFFRESTTASELASAYQTALATLQGAVGGDVAIASQLSAREQDVEDVLGGVPALPPAACAPRLTAG